MDLTAKFSISDLSRLKRILETRRMRAMFTLGSLPFTRNSFCDQDIGKPPLIYDIEPIENLVCSIDSSSDGGVSLPILDRA